MKNSLRPTLAVIAALVLAAGPVRADQKTKTLDFYWVDSEGGGSTLIVTPQGESVLIDTGNPGGRDAARIVAAAKAAGLAKIDHVVITHWHIDHFGGAAEVAQQLPFGAIHQRAIPAGDPDGRASSSFQLQIKPFREITAHPLTSQIGNTQSILSRPILTESGGPIQVQCLVQIGRHTAPELVRRAERELGIGRMAALYGQFVPAHCLRIILRPTHTLLVERAQIFLGGPRA